MTTGTAAICFRCASATFSEVTHPCPVCSRELGDDGTCGNPLCNDASREIERIAAIAVKTGPIDSRIKRLKYAGRVGWATIFGRIILGYLEEHCQPDDYDLIVANPTFVGAGSDRTVRHTELVIEAAANEDVFSEWPFDIAEPRAIVKTGPSHRSAAGNYAAKRAAADELLLVLHVPDRSRTERKRILVYDDICTTALQLDRVAWHLKTAGGATSVEAIVMARTPWRR